MCGLCTLSFMKASLTFSLFVYSHEALSFLFAVTDQQTWLSLWNLSLREVDLVFAKTKSRLFPALQPAVGNTPLQALLFLPSPSLRLTITPCFLLDGCKITPKASNPLYPPPALQKFGLCVQNFFL